MEKIKYEFDPYNRLTVKNSSLRGMRMVLDGQFKISGQQNTFAYQIKSPLPGNIKIPHQIKLKGTWSLTKEHQLCLTLDKSARQTFGEQLVLQGEIIDLRKNALLFAVTTRAKDSKFSVYAFELCGDWQADERNRLTFRVRKQGNRFDTLIFDGAWQVNDNYQIVYSYQKERLIRKARQIHSLILQGQWLIEDKARLSYILGADSLSGLDFSADIGIFRENYIKYDLGIRVSGKKQPARRTITFFGKWKFKKNVGLVFEVQRQGRKIETLVFGAQARLTDKSTVSLNLRNSLNKETGVELELSRDIFSGDGQAFLRLLKSQEESAIIAGAGWRW